MYFIVFCLNGWNTIIKLVVFVIIPLILKFEFKFDLNFNMCWSFLIYKCISKISHIKHTALIPVSSIVMFCRFCTNIKVRQRLYTICDIIKNMDENKNRFSRKCILNETKKIQTLMPFLPVHTHFYQRFRCLRRQLVFVQKQTQLLF